MPRYFEDLQVGDGFDTPGRTITEADLVGFAAISGDHDALDLSTTEPGLSASGLGFGPPDRSVARITVSEGILGEGRLGAGIWLRGAPASRKT